MEGSKKKPTYEELEQEIERSKKVVKALMGKVERSIENQGGSFSLFEGNILLNKKVGERTEELKIATEKLDKEKRKLTDVIEAIPGVMFIFNNNGEILEKYKGADSSLSTLIELNNISEFPYRFKFEFSKRKAGISLGVIQSFRFDLNNPKKYFSASMSPFGQGDIAVNIVDVTDQVEAEELIKIQETKIVQTAKLSSLGEMAGGIAHEINNPLSIIAGKVTMMKRSIELGKVDHEKLLSELAKIGLTVERIAKIVKGLRTFSRSAEKDPFEVTSLASIIEDSLGLCQERFKNHGVELRVQSIPDAEFSCRATEISQVLINLLNNAFDAIESLGNSEKWISINFEKYDSTIKILIEDVGPGISEEILDKIMQPFFTTKAIGKGTGLGLSISKGIIEDHQGRLFYDNTKGHTCFVIELPSNIKQVKSA